MPTPPNWPFPTRDRPLTPVKAEAPRRSPYPHDMPEAPW